MQEFLQNLLQLPTLFFGAGLAISVLYWLLIIIGAADLNPFDGAEGALKGGVEGAAKGVAEGIGEGASAVKASFLTEALSFLGLTKVPVTISFSLFSLFAWFLSYATRHALDPILPNVLSALAATGVAVVGGFGITSLMTKPLSGLFKEKHRPGGKGLVGRTVRITTEVVDATRGQGEVDDGAGGITVSIRCESGTLKRGDEAVILEAEPEAGLYWVEPLNTLFTNDPAALAKPAEQTVEHAAAAVGNGSTDQKPS
jgi:hypothetical protein